MTVAAARAEAADRKTQLLEVLTRAALRENSSPVSLRQFAIAAGVSEPTLRYHFNDRQGLVIAILRHVAIQAQDYLERSAVPGSSHSESVRGYGEIAMEGFDTDLFARAHAFALVEAMHDPVAARAYLETMIEPSLQAIERRLAPTLNPNGTARERVRHTAFSLYAPILLAIIHQRLLRGDEARPLNMQTFFDFLTGLITRGVPPETETPKA